MESEKHCCPAFRESEIREPVKSSSPRNSCALREVKTTVASHKGLVRSNNEDNCSVNGVTRSAEEESYGFVNASEANALLLEVCDGMGGEEGGEIASEIAVKCSADLYEKLRTVGVQQIAPTVNDYVKTANSVIRQTLHSGGGTTFALVYIRKNIAYPFSLGDSRIYLFNEGELHQISTDHTLAMKKAKAGMYSFEEAEKSPDRNLLTLFLGADHNDRGLEAEAYAPFRLIPGSKLLICSDGLYDMCSKKEITDILSSDCPNISDELVKAALEHGGRDNVTCIVAEIK